MMMNKQVVSLLILLLPLATDLVSATTNRPGSSFSANVFGDVETAAPLEFTPEDIALCCSGNADYGFLMRDLQVDTVAEFDEADGFSKIPGNSLWTCRGSCRDPANAFEDVEACLEVCDCRQGCPSSNDTLTVECRDECNFPEDSEEQGFCLETCHTHCGERCRSTFNGYVIPANIYDQALSILDCYYGDIIGEPEASCLNTSVYWEAQGYACNYTAGVDFDCRCIIPGSCPNVEYPCKYDFHCVSEAPSLVPSSSPSDVPSVIPSASPSAAPSAYPTWSPTPKPTKGKAGRPIHATNEEEDDDDDDDFVGDDIVVIVDDDGGRGDDDTPQVDDDTQPPEGGDDDEDDDEDDDDDAGQKKKAKKDKDNDDDDRRRRSRRGRRRRRDRRILN